MATSAIAAGILNYFNTSIHAGFDKGSKSLQQLGEDLSSDNMSAAQEDFSTLLQSSQQSSTGSTGTISQAFSQLGSDLTSGNLSAAQQDFSAIQQDLQSQSGGFRSHHHHHSAGITGGSQIGQLFSQLGADMQAGNLSSAQQAYAALQQDLSQWGATSVQAVPSAGISAAA